MNLVIQDLENGIDGPEGFGKRVALELKLKINIFFP